jgi:RNA polymerase subunit RPABC4/transcription elongation factor Spt4
MYLRLQHINLSLMQDELKCRIERLEFKVAEYKLSRRIERLERIVALISKKCDICPNCENAILPGRYASSSAVAAMQLTPRICPSCHMPEFTNPTAIKSTAKSNHKPEPELQFGFGLFDTET